jgi:hypothetical protein
VPMQLWLSNDDSTEAMTDYSQYDDWLNAGGPEADRSGPQAGPPPGWDVSSRTVADSWSPVPKAPGSTGPAVWARTAKPAQARIRPGVTVLITLSANQWVTEVRVVP